MVKLSPPWYITWNEVKAAVEKTPGVTVGPLDVSKQPYAVPITVQDHDQAVAMASILVPRDGPYVTVQVTDGAGATVPPAAPANAEELASMFQTALAGNPYLAAVKIRPFGPFPESPLAVWPLFAPAVIQFYDDDTSDYFGNFSGTVAAVFQRILNPAPGGIRVCPSTARQA